MHSRPLFQVVSSMKSRCLFAVALLSATDLAPVLAGPISRLTPRGKFQTLLCSIGIVKERVHVWDKFKMSLRDDPPDKDLSVQAWEDNLIIGFKELRSFVLNDQGRYLVDENSRPIVTETNVRLSSNPRGHCHPGDPTWDEYLSAEESIEYQLRQWHEWPNLGHGTARFAEVAPIYHIMYIWWGLTGLDRNINDVVRGSIHNRLYDIAEALFWSMGRKYHPSGDIVHAEAILVDLVDLWWKKGPKLATNMQDGPKIVELEQALFVYRRQVKVTEDPTPGNILLRAY